MRRKKSVRITVLKAITTVAAVLFTLAVCSMDSDSYIPVVVGFICEAWLALMAYANKDRVA
jgi:hypothetical protein